MNGSQLTSALLHVADVIEASKDWLCELDGAVGDGDHGVSMTIGWRTARKALCELANPTPENALRTVSEAYADEVGAASGVLYETAFEAAAVSVASKNALYRADDWAVLLEAIAAEIQHVGKAQLGDKTLLDAWIPAAAAARKISNEGGSKNAALDAAALSAKQGLDDTRNLIPKRGRAARLGERARGFQDAGAASAWLIVKALADAARQISLGGTT